MLLIRTIRQSDYSDVSDLIRTSFAKHRMDTAMSPNWSRRSEKIKHIRNGSKSLPKTITKLSVTAC